MPTTVADLAAYFEAVRPELMCTPAAASAMSYLLEYVGSGEGEADAEAAELWRDIADAAIAALPDWAVALDGEQVPQVPEALDRFGAMSTNAQTAVRQALGVLDAIFLGEPGVLEARQRLQLRIRQAE